MIKTVLYISNHCITVYQSQRQAVELVCRLLWTDKRGIDNLLAELPPKSPVSIILDLLEEEIAVEVFPKLNLWDKRAVREQQIQQQLIEGAIFANATWAEECNNSRATEQSLLTTSIPGSAVLNGFMSDLEEAQIMLTAIYSTSFLLASYFKKDLVPTLGLNKEQLNLPLLLITRQSENVYRQTFLNQSAVYISRLIDISSHDLSSEQALIAEAKLTQNYLYNQEIIGTEEPISYLVLDSGKRRLEQIEALSLQFGFTQPCTADSAHFFKTVNLDADSTASGRATDEYYTAQALVGYLVRRSPPSFFTPSYVRRVNNLQSGARIFLAVNSLILLALSIYITTSIVDVYISQQRLNLIEQSVENHHSEEKRLQNIVKHQPDGEVLKATVVLSESILTLKSNRPLGVDIKSIAKVVAKQAEHIKLMRMDWKQLGQMDSARYQIEINGLVYPFTGYYQAPVKWVDGFKDALLRLPSVTQVEITKEPLNRDLKQALTVTANEARTRVSGLPFQVRLEVAYGAAD